MDKVVENERKDDIRLGPDWFRDKKIAVIGIGGVGGYLAGVLGKTYSGVTLGARGRRQEVLQRDGLVLHSDYHGEIVFLPEKVVTVGEMDIQDYIFVCVKNYSLERVCEEMKQAVGNHTVIVPVMNGVDCADKVRRLVGKGIVVDALIYIVAFANDDFSITQEGNFANLRIGVKREYADPAALRAVGEVASLLDGAGIDYILADDIECEIWRKYILNCAYNVTTAYYNNNIGQIRRDEWKAQEYEALVDEAYQVALAKGVQVTQEHRDTIIHRFYFEYDDGATSSLQRDVRDGKPSEIETFSGYLVHEAQRLGIETPVSQKMYEGLLQKTR